MTVLAVVLGAAAGAPCRYLLDRFVQVRHRQGFPWGLVVVNLLGCLVLGIVTGVADQQAVPAALLAGLATGWCGAFTTYSSFGYETVRLARRHRGWLAVINVVITVPGGLAAIAIGIAAGHLLAR